MLKRALPRDKGVEITLINEAPKSYYSGMLPGAVSSIVSLLTDIRVI